MGYDVLITWTQGSGIYDTIWLEHKTIGVYDAITMWHNYNYVMRLFSLSYYNIWIFYDAIITWTQKMSIWCCKYVTESGGGIFSIIMWTQVYRSLWYSIIKWTQDYGFYDAIIMWYQGCSINDAIMEYKSTVVCDVIISWKMEFYDEIIMLTYIYRELWGYNHVNTIYRALFWYKTQGCGVYDV